MTAQILSLNGAHRGATTKAGQSLTASASLNVEIPHPLAQRIANDARWAGKTPEQFVLDFLQAAYPVHTGAA